MMIESVGAREIFFLFNEESGSVNYEKIEEAPQAFLKNTSYISETVFMMKDEVSCTIWRDYLYSLQLMYGEKSKEYYNAVLNMNQMFLIKNIDSSGKCMKKIPDSYFYDNTGIYDSYPIVNITQQQAMDFADFYADRLYEWILYKNGKLKTLYQFQEGNFFTRERYLQGRDPNTRGDIFPFYLEGRLPSKEEYAAAKQTNEIYLRSLESKCRNEKALSKLSDKIDKNLKTVNKSGCNNFGELPFKPVVVNYNKKVPLFDFIRNLDGNVREWSSVSGKSLGAGYQDSPMDTYDYVTEDASLPWVGCRVVFEWKEYIRD